ncbi:protein-tyrosine phosphatase family protein [Methanospirillum hungatei]|uniref:protein-tyrosine phosphatase family protein n=1 Tax=Methanospirillum hungatei TaxID=2203 RepID=UPI0026EE8E3A|nr:protein-tyrosine phosphatase family protein [Methanospirillum hungatei]MCA1915961.1 tyrosine-protein phosphatase [Methanospirillum hungatei]
MEFEAKGLLFRKVALPDHLPGSLFLHPMPGRYEDIGTFLSELEKRNIQTIISLPGFDEIASISPEYMDLIRNEDRAITIECFPISDFGVPERPDDLLKLAKKYAEHLKKGDSILVHCRMGIGRTGLFAVTLLMASGIERSLAEKIVRSAGAGPQTRPQADFLLWAEQALRE